MPALPIMDIFLGENFYENNIQMGRYDADFETKGEILFVKIWIG